ncbi:biorientation of chromosomes in cell division protein 1-like 1 [Anopheles stephensi]|uniref:biorientation of chromosomes in cell division protein 1-like 1 n=1 Tax=Anopheles stephensi TaxID=30069 RepID=UPI001658ACA2|nr:biorientation of chromosomes in cell division protein 1-like 1 [Anopheles stephensi]
MVDDPHFIDAMVQELKSQGLFDQFRKECLADVDTKPAYQNLRQRVEGTVNKFLGQQEWSDNIRYKNQLRDQLRKNIIESGFLDAGVERIVDQVVNPKIATIFQPKVEEIVYNYLGIEKPKSSFNGNEHPVTHAESLLEDLEAVSPDSDKKSDGCLTPSPPPQPPQPPPPAEEPDEHVVENMDIDEEEEDDDPMDESKEQDDFESPAFEPLEVRSPSKTKDETNDESNSSVISGLTSQESVKSCDDREDSPAPTNAKQSTDVPPTNEQQTPTTKDSEFSQEVAPTNDSQLSQVSSNSQLLTATAQSSSEEVQPPKENERLDITEEAQMPTLFSSSMDKVSSSNEGENDGAEGSKKITFDFKKDEYDFVGTGRPSAMASTGDESLGDANRERDQEDDSTPTVTPTETPTETPEKPKDADQPNIALQDEETSQSEHSLKICEDTFSDDNTKDSRSQEDQASARDSPSKIKGLSDASSCSVKSDPGRKNIPSSPVEKHAEKTDETEQEQEKEEEEEEAAEKKEGEEKNGEEETIAQKDKDDIAPSKEDDHYQEHSKHQNNNRRSSDRDSEDGNDKHGSGGSGPPPPPPSDGNACTEEKLPSSQESSDKAPEKEKSPPKDATDAVQSPTSSKKRDRSYRSVTPSGGRTPIDSSSSGIQSGDDSEKSPETLKSYSKPESIVLPVQPVVIDQMLTSADDSKIERLLNGETQTNDATLESLQRQWQSSTEGKIRKPIFASNFFEARRLVRVRKKMQRHEQKCREKALAMAKKYINENKAFAGHGMEDQGIELEFVCDGKRKSPGPMISSPVPKVEPATAVEQAPQPVPDPELLYFPEEREVYGFDEQRLNFLRSKTDGVTFGKNFKVQHYRTIICSLTVATAPTPRVSKRPTTSAFGSAKIRRTEALNGVTKKLDLSADGGKNGTSMAMGKQRSIRSRLVEKSTPPSVGTDA